MNKMPISYLNSLEGLNKRVEKLEEGGSAKKFNYDVGETVTLPFGDSTQTITNAVAYDTNDKLISYEGIGIVKDASNFPSQLEIYIPLPFTFPVGGFNTFFAYNVSIYIKLIDLSGNLNKFETGNTSPSCGTDINEPIFDSDGHMLMPYIFTFDTKPTFNKTNIINGMPIICGWKSSGYKQYPAYMHFTYYTE